LRYFVSPQNFGVDEINALSKQCKPTCWKASASLPTLNSSKVKQSAQSSFSCRNTFSWSLAFITMRSGKRHRDPKDPAEITCAVHVGYSNPPTQDRRMRHPNSSQDLLSPPPAGPHLAKGEVMQSANSEKAIWKYQPLGWAAWD